MYRMMMITCLLAGLTTQSVCETPNYVRAMVFAHDSAITDVNNSGFVHAPVTSTSFSDGLGNKFQSMVHKGDGDLIACTIYDALGRDSICIKPFFVTNNNHRYFESGPQYSTWFSKARSAHESEGGGNFPYSETHYAKDPLGRICETAAPGTEFAMNSGHTSKVWFFGSTRASNRPYVLDNDGFVQVQYLSDANLASGGLIETQINTFASSNPESVKFFLTVTRDPNGNYAQELKNILGKVIANWADPDGVGNGTVNNAAIVSKYEYDLAGNLIAEYPPLSNVVPNRYWYNKLNQLVKKSTADAGVVEYKYDRQGRMIYCRNALQSAKSQFFAFTFDEIGRPLTVCVLSVNIAGFFESLNSISGVSQYLDAPKVINPDNSKCKVKTRNVYDNPVVVRDFVSRPELSSVLSTLTNTAGRLVATIAYGEDLDQNGIIDEVVELYSYDSEGRIDRRYKSIPGIPLQTFTFSYDLQGKVLMQTYNNGTRNVITQYAYNRDGQIKSLVRDNRLAVSYTYDVLGRLIKKTFHGGNGSMRDVEYSYNIRDWQKKIYMKDMFTEEIFYNDFISETKGLRIFSPQYNGNISRIKILQPSDSHSVIDVRYAYDRVNRLMMAWNKAGTAIDTCDDDFDASYAYDRNGRIVSKSEGKGLYKNWGGYVYAADNNQLKYINNSPKAASRYAGRDTYVYDPNGNMVFDRSKIMAIKYDWRDLPIEFTFYKTDPGSLTWNSIDALPKSNLASGVKMVYDASGNRVLKKEYAY